MKRPSSACNRSRINQRIRIARWKKDLCCLTGLCGLLALVWPVAASAQAVTINTRTGTITNDTNGSLYTVDRRFQQIHPTHIVLPDTPLDARTRQELIRFLEADHGFAMRPFPLGHKGLTLEANGDLHPAGEDYLNMVTANGLSAKPGDVVVLTDVKIEHSRIIFQLNGGPDRKHRFLRHIEIGAGPVLNPVVGDDATVPTGARLTLVFHNEVPELTGKQVEALLAPLISFEVKTPIQAFTDTLPPKLKDAILDHHVLVGMSTDMVLFAKGRPENKIREMDGQMPIEIWIYGKPPQDVDFVRINGNRVIRVEIAAVGKPLKIFTQDEVEGMMRTDGTPLDPGDSNAHTVEMGDVQRNPDTQAPAAPPSLRNPGEKLPSDTTATDATGRVGVMKPVQFPKQKPDDQPNARPDNPSGSAPAPSQTPAASSPTPSGVQSPPPDASQPAPANPNGSQPPPQ
jgi:hypothetical protein